MPIGILENWRWFNIHPRATVRMYLVCILQERLLSLDFHENLNATQTYIKNLMGWIYPPPRMQPSPPGWHETFLGNPEKTTKPFICHERSHPGKGVDPTQVATKSLWLDGTVRAFKYYNAQAILNDTTQQNGLRSTSKDQLNLGYLSGWCPFWTFWRLVES